MRNKEARERRKGNAGAASVNSREVAEKTAVALIAMVNGLVGLYFGEDCSMTEIEEGMITDPLIRILARQAPSKIADAEKFIDPIMLLVGLGMWTSRIAEVQKSKRPVEAEEAGVTIVTPKRRPGDDESNGRKEASYNSDLRPLEQ